MPYNLRAATTGEGGGDGGSGIRLASSKSSTETVPLAWFTLSTTRSHAAAHTGLTPGCCENDRFTRAK